MNIPAGKYDVTVRSIHEFVVQMERSGYVELSDANRFIPGKCPFF